MRRIILSLNLEHNCRRQLFKEDFIMKKLVLIMGSFLFASVALASNLQIMNTVVSSDAAKEATAKMAAQGYSVLNKVELSQTYRCPGCFDYTLVFSNRSSANTLKSTAVLNTSGFGPTIKVGIKSLSIP